MDEAFIAYKKEVERSYRVIRSMPIINEDLRAMHTFMQDMYRVWLDKLNEIERASTKISRKAERTGKFRGTGEYSDAE